MLARAISSPLLIAYVLPEVTEASLTDSLTKPDTVLAESVAFERLKELAAAHCSRDLKHLFFAEMQSGRSSD